MSDSFDIYTLIFLGLAIFIFVRLRSVLGTRTGQERPPADPYIRREATPVATTNENVVALPPRPKQPEAGIPSAAQRSWNNAVPEGSAAATGLQAIAQLDSDFDITRFLKNSASAYEMIVSAFGAGEKEALKDFLGADVMDGFSQAIDERQARGEHIETEFVAIRPEQVKDASLIGQQATIVVAFRSDVISVIRNTSGEIVDGSPDQITEVKDIWTFTRDLSSVSPIWKLISTEA
jgi:predicted lipid-binding transport protein (Tim44 family)